MCQKRFCHLGFIFLFLLLVAQGCSAGDKDGSGLSFTRVQEPNEAAFSILIPQGWGYEGGLYRVDPLQAGGPLNSMEAKCDLIFKSDREGTVSFHILPDVVYGHANIGGGFFPVGSNYQGARIRPYEDALTHLRNLFAYLHPQAAAVQTLKISRLPGEIEAMDRGLSYTNRLLAQIGMPHMAYRSDAAGGVFEYEEGGKRYREVLLAGIVNMPAAMTWKNTRCLAFRVPVEAFDRWRPVMDVMRNSIRFNPKWILSESKGQQERARIIEDVFKEIRRIDQEIVAKTTVNREEIMNDNYLVLTGQEEYVNPHTNEVVVDTDAFKYRWETAGGDVYYTDKEEEDPNIFLKRNDYKRTLVRKRRNE